MGQETSAPMSEADFVRLTKECRAEICSAARFNQIARSGIREIYERQGWKAKGYKSWAECVEAEFGIKLAHSYRLITASIADEEIAPVNDIGEIPECVLRPLVGLPPETKREAFTEAVKAAREAGQDKPTQAQVVAAVEKVAPDAVSPRGESPKPNTEAASATSALQEEIHGASHRLKTAKGLIGALLSSDDWRLLGYRNRASFVQAELLPLIHGDPK